MLLRISAETASTNVRNCCCSCCLLDGLADGMHGSFATFLKQQNGSTFYVVRDVIVCTRLSSSSSNTTSSSHCPPNSSQLSALPASALSPDHGQSFMLSIIDNAEMLS